VKIECVKGDASVEIEPSNNVGEMKERSGYQPMMLYSGEIIWVCPGCVARLRPALEAMKSVFGEKLQYAFMRTAVGWLKP